THRCSRADVRVRVDPRVLADHGIRFDPRSAGDLRARSHSRARFDIGAGLDEGLRVHLRAVRDEATAVGVLAVTQRRALVVLDIDVVLAHISSSTRTSPDISTTMEKAISFPPGDGAQR